MVFNSEKSLMRTGLFSSRTKMISYLLLRFIADKDEPAGSWVLREDLLSFGIDCSTATIGRYLKELDYREYTVQKSNQGRVLTPIGQAHLEELEERLERTRMQEKAEQGHEGNGIWRVDRAFICTACVGDRGGTAGSHQRRGGGYRGTYAFCGRPPRYCGAEPGSHGARSGVFMRSWPTSATTSLFAPF